MHAFHEYLGQQLTEKLKRRRVVVWYDPRGEFRPYIRELCSGGDPLGCAIQGVDVGGLRTHLCVFCGSFFEVKFAVEPIVAADEPEPLLIYIPGIERDRKESLLIELEAAGECYEPQLKRLARNVLRQQYSDGQIDEMLAAETATYEDVVSLLQQENGRQRSMVRVIFADAHGDNAALLADWLVSPKVDGVILEKGARGELLKLIDSRLGLEIEDGTELAMARTKTIRYVLVGELRDALSGEPPPSVAMIPAPAIKDHVKFVREVAETLRKRHPEKYIEIADQVERDLGLASQSIAAPTLGRVDTFRFEEKVLLRYIGQLICDRKFEEAQGIVTKQCRSFWTDRFVLRRQQWEACRLMAQLGTLTREVRGSLPRTDAPAKAWLDRYTAEDGWYRLERAQRDMESLVTNMTEDPESEIAPAQVRSEYEQLVQDMAVGFGAALRQAGWSVPQTLHQTSVYRDMVEGKPTPLAYFLVDSMRYEMGAELLDQLSDADELTLKAAIAAIPTITPVGMAALLPGASASFSIVETDGKLAAQVDGAILSDWPSRLKYLKSRVPGLVEFELPKLLDTSSGPLRRKLEKATVVIVRSQDIDESGELVGGRIARQVMDTAIGNIARAVRKLADLGIEQFVITADHGHLFTSAKEESMRMDNPGGEVVELHRRCWIGRGGTTPSGTARVSGTELGYETNLEFVFPFGGGVFKAGGDLAYHHGGVSLQEVVIPVLSVRMVRQVQKPKLDVEIQLSGIPERLTNRTFGITIAAVGTLFTTHPIVVRPVLLSGGVQVGESGMAVDAEFDQSTRCIKLQPGKPATVAMLLKREDCHSVRVVVQDPKTDAVLAQSNEIAVELGM